MSSVATRATPPFVLGAGSYPTPKAARDAGVATINYGVSLDKVLNFVIVSFVLFRVARQMNALRRPAEPAAPADRDYPYCATAVPARATRCPHCTSAL